MGVSDLLNSRIPVVVVVEVVVDVPPDEAAFDVLHVVPSIQLVTPLLPVGASTRRLRSMSRKRAAVDSLPVLPTPTALLPPAPYSGQ